MRKFLIFVIFLNVLAVAIHLVNFILKNNIYSLTMCILNSLLAIFFIFLYRKEVRK